MLRSDEFEVSLDHWSTFSIMLTTNNHSVRGGGGESWWHGQLETQRTEFESTKQKETWHAKLLTEK